MYSRQIDNNQPYPPLGKVEPNIDKGCNEVRAKHRNNFDSQSDGLAPPFQRWIKRWINNVTIQNDQTHNLTHRRYSD